MKTRKQKSRWTQVQLTAGGRSKLRTAIRLHPSVAQYVQSGSAVSALNKAGLLDLAEKLGINYLSVIQATEREISWNSTLNPKFAFSGIVEFDFTMTLLGQSATRRARICYQHTPDWAYFDTERNSERNSERIGTDDMPEGSLESHTYSLEIQSVNDSAIGYSGDELKKYGVRTRKPGTPFWEKCNDLTEFGILPDAIWEECDRLVDNDCRRQDATNRKRALIKSADERATTKNTE